MDESNTGSFINIESTSISNTLSKTWAALLPDKLKLRPDPEYLDLSDSPQGQMMMSPKAFAPTVAMLDSENYVMHRYLILSIAPEFHH